MHTFHKKYNSENKKGYSVSNSPSPVEWAESLSFADVACRDIVYNSKEQFKARYICDKVCSVERRRQVILSMINSESDINYSIQSSKAETSQFPVNLL